jgi:sec-independent protein translocase protein TatC
MLNPAISNHKVDGLMNQPFIKHVQELRRRLMWCAIVLAIGAGVGYLLRDPILTWLQAPLHGKLYYSQVMGAFEFLMQACFLAGFIPAIPVIVYNLVSFVRPALPQPISRQQIFTIVAASSLLTVGGVLFAYYVSLPVVLRFLSSIDVSHLHPLIAANSYLSFVINYLAVFAAIFQLPLLMLFIDRITPIPPATLRKWRKWVILGAFAAAFILPIAPDPVSQVMLALPIIILYEVSIWLLVYRHRPRRTPVPEVRQQPTRIGTQRPMTVVAATGRPDRQAAGVDPFRVRRPKVIDMRPHS